MGSAAEHRVARKLHIEAVEMGGGRGKEEGKGGEVGERKRGYSSN